MKHGNAYELFCAKHLEEADIESDKVRKELLRQWCSMNSEERRPYEEEAAKLEIEEKTAYTVFCEEIEEEIQAEYPLWSPQKVRKESYRRWCSLLPENRRTYEEKVMV